MPSVKIGKNIDYQTFRKAVRNAANEMGWIVKENDTHRKKIDFGNNEETEEYVCTRLTIKKALPKAWITIYNKESVDSFEVGSLFTKEKNFNKFFDYLKSQF